MLNSLAMVAHMAAVDVCWVRTCCVEGGADDTWCARMHTRESAYTIISVEVLGADLLLLTLVLVVSCLCFQCCCCIKICNVIAGINFEKSCQV